MAFRGFLYRFDRPESALLYLQKLSRKESAYPSQFGGVLVTEEFHVIDGDSSAHEAARALRGKLSDR